MQKVRSIIQFETMITPVLAKGLFWAGSAFALLSVFMAHSDQRLVTFGGACVFVVLLRIACEIVLTLFKR